ncbi:MAG: hypothetical protein ABH951_00620 [Patescibacteria group bacterium]
MKVLKIYSIVITLLLILAGFLTYTFYSQAKATKSKLLVTQSLLEQNRIELDNLKLLINANLYNIKVDTALLNDSLAAFLVSGDSKISSISEISATKISSDVQTITDNQKRVALEQGWNEFLKTKTVSNYLAFSRFLIQSIQNSLENIY